MKYSYIFETTYKLDDEKLFIEHATQDNVHELIHKYVEMGAKEMFVHGEHVDSIVVPKGYEVVACSGMGLKELVLPDGVNILYANNNRLKHIELPEDIEIVDLSHNFLTHVDFRRPPTKLISLDLHANYMQELMFEPPNIFGYLKISRNKDLQMKNIHPEIVKKIETDEEFLDTDI